MKKLVILGTHMILVILFVMITPVSSKGDIQQSQTKAEAFQLLQDSLITAERAPFINRLPSSSHKLLAEGKAKALENLRFKTTLNKNPDLWAKEDYDVTFYDLFLNVDDINGLLDGRLRMIANSKVDGLTEILVQLSPPLTVDSVISPIGPLTFNHSNHLINITPSTILNSDEEFDFTIYYHGPPGADPYSAISMYPGSIGTSSEPFGSHTWWPCKDSPADKADSMYIAIEIDSSLYCGSNGTLDSIVASGGDLHTFYYSERYPIVTYLVSIECHPYSIQHDRYIYNDGLDTMPIINLVMSGLDSSARASYKIVPEVLAVFSDMFGEYPFVEEKYGNAHSEVTYGMEHQTLTSLQNSESAMAWDVVVHEAAHQWWGDLITCATWADIWLNEGFATYCEILWDENQNGPVSAKLLMRDIEYLQGGTVYCYDSTNSSQIFSLRSYWKGGWVLHMLRSVLGDSLFFNSMKAYYNSEYQYASATTEQFKNVVEQASGIELDWFFQQWIFGQYYPNYNYYYTWEPSDSSGYDVYLIVKQIQTTAPQVFKAPLDLAIYYTATEADTVEIMVDERRKLIKLNLNEDIIGLWFDVTEKVLNVNSWETWTMFITSLSDEFTQIIPGEPYLDTIEVIGGSGDYTFSLSDGQLPIGIILNSDGIITGQTEQTGWFEFEVSLVDNIQSYTDNSTFMIYAGTHACCGKFTDGATGNSNCDTEGLRNLADITRLIDNVYISKTELCCLENGNINGDAGGLINLADITKLIDHVYITKSPTATCL